MIKIIEKAAYGLKKPSRMWHFAGEWLKWNLGGRKIRSPEAIEEIYNTCKGCEESAPADEQEVICTVCECFVHKTAKTMNKAAWSTTKCPLKDPKWG